MLKLKNSREVREALAHIGANEGAAEFFTSRRDMMQVFVSGVRTPAANIIKQEALSRGADAAVHSQALTCGIDRCSVILFATAKQLRFIAEKLKRMPWWGLEKLADELVRLTVKRSACTSVLPSGNKITFGERTLVMAIINATDDSFYSESRTYGNAETALEHALQAAREDADIIDIGAESTRPGAERVAEHDEIDRITDAVKLIRQALPSMPISIDTTRASVARAALEQGADIINDISGLAYDAGIADAAADAGAMLVLMHMRGTPCSMCGEAKYDNLIDNITAELENSVSEAVACGVPRERLIIDPGLGFAKNYNQNLMILKHLESFRAIGLPLLVGASRKSFIGQASEAETPQERLHGTLAVSTIAALHGADIVRVHDVRANKAAIMTAEAIKHAEYE